MLSNLRSISRHLLFLVFFLTLPIYSQNMSLHFDGTDDYVDCGNNSLFTPTDAITICTWINTDIIGLGQTILWRGDVWQNYYGIKLSEDGIIRGTIFPDQYTHIYSQRALQKNTWYHIALTYDRFSPDLNFKLYINGVLDGSVSTNGQMKWDSNPLLIGMYPWYYNPFIFFGEIRDLQIWNRMLTQEEIRQKMNGISDPESEQGLVGYWPMNEGQGNIIYDLSGNGNDGLVYGAQWTPINELNAIISTNSIWLDEDYDGFANENVDAGLSTGKIVSYTWLVGNDTISVESNPDITLPTGSYYLKLIIRDSMDVVNIDSTMISVYAAKFNTNGPIYSAVSQLNFNTFFISSADDKVYQFDSTGAIKWTYQTGGYIESTVTASDENNIFVTSSDTRLYSFNNIGIPNWDKAMGGVIVSTPTVNEDNSVFVGLTTGRLFAISYNGDIQWSVQTEGAIVSSPVIGSDGTIYFGSKDKKLYSVSDGGQVLWSFTTLDSITSSAALGNDSSIVFASEDGNIFKLDLNGNLTWGYETDGAIYASPVIGENGQIFIGSTDGFLYSVSKDGNLLWKYNADSPIKSTAALSMDASSLYFGTESGKIVALSVDGDLLWQLQTESSVSSPVLVTNNNLLLAGNTDGSIFIMKIITGSQNLSLLEWPTFLGNNRRTGDQNTPLTGITYKELLPSDFLLTQNFPNPFNPVTTIDYFLPNDSDTKIYIHNLLGEKIEEFALGTCSAGSGQIKWDASNYPSGIYFYSINAIPTNGNSEFRSTKKMVLMK